MLDLQRLRLLATFADRGSIAATAAAWGYSPSAVSQQLSTLEREAGTPLLKRTPRRAELTAAGQLLADRARHILAAVESAETALLEAAARPAGRVTVAGIPTALVALAPGVIRRLQRYPETTLQMRQASPEEALRQLRAGGTDLALIDQWSARPPRDPGRLIEYRHLLTDPLVLAVPRRHRLADESHPYDLSDLLDERWIAAPRPAASRLAIDALHQLKGRRPPVPWELDGLDAVLTLVGRGLGVTVAPALALVPGHPGVVMRALPDRVEPRQLYLVTRSARSSSPAVALTSAAFIGAATDVVAQWAREG